MAGKGKGGRAIGRQFRNQTHKRYNEREGYASKSAPRRSWGKWVSRKRD